MTSLLERECAAQSLSFERVVKWQYVITDNPKLTFSMRKLSLGKWSAFVGTGVSVAHLVDNENREIGLFLGVGIDDEGLVAERYSLPDVNAESPHFWNDFENWLNSVSGRYTILIQTEHGTRIYNDPVGMNGCDYDREARTVASSPLLCIDRPIRWHPEYDRKKVQRGDSKYSLFHTCDQSVRRCNPNFFLNLDDFEETRFWPRNEAFTSRPEDYPSIYTALAKNTQRVIQHTGKAFETVVPISGGQDSRLLLALLGSGVRDIDLFFTHIHNYAGRIDACIATEIARRLQLKHVVFDKRDIKRNRASIAKLTKEFSVGCGYAMPAPREMALGLHDKLPEDAVVLRGHQSDVLRAVFIDKLGDRARANFRWQIKRLLIVPRNEFDTSVFETFEPEYQAWHDTIPQNAQVHSVDLMFLEIYYSSTIGAGFPALSHNFLMSPFNSRNFLQTAMSIDEKYRRKSYAVNDILIHMNPAIHDVLFDYEFDSSRTLSTITDIEAMDEAVKTRREQSIARYQTWHGDRVDE